MTYSLKIIQKVKFNEPSCTSIEHLYFTEEEFIELAEALKTNTWVTNIQLYGYCLTKPSAEALAETLKVNNIIKDIRILNSKCGPEGAKALAEALELNTTITTFSLSSSCINNEGAKAFANALQKNTTLKVFNLDGNNILAEGAEALAETLKKNSTITHISLNNNPIGPKGVASLAESLETHTLITQLYLNRNNIDSSGAKSLAAALKKNSSITKISLQDNPIGSEGAIELADALKENSTISFINLQNTNIGPQEAKVLGSALKKNSTITDIELQNNNIGPEGAKALTKALMKNSRLRYINLGSNKMGPEGAGAFAKILPVNTTITLLMLQSNNIGSKGAKALAETISENTTLKHISLYNNHIGDEGLIYLAKALETNTSITTLNLGLNDISDQGVEALAKSLEINTSITGINLQHNFIQTKGEEALAKSLQNNYSIYEVYGVRNSDTDRIILRNRAHLDKTNRLSELIDKVYYEQELTTEEEIELNSLMNELPKLSPYKDNLKFGRFLERKIELILSDKENSFVTKLQRSLNLIDKQAFNFMIANEIPQENDLSPNDVVFLQEKSSITYNNGAQREGYTVKGLFFKDHFGKMHSRELNGLDLHHFIHTNNNILLTTNAIQPHKEAIQNELHLQGIIRQFNLSHFDSQRLIEDRYRQLSHHELYKQALRQTNDSILSYEQVQLLARWLNEDVAAAHYDFATSEWGRHKGEHRTIDDWFDEKVLKNAIQIVGNTLDNYNKKENIVVSEALRAQPNLPTRDVENCLLLVCHFLDKANFFAYLIPIIGQIYLGARLANKCEPLTKKLSHSFFSPAEAHIYVDEIEEELLDWNIP